MKKKYPRRHTYNVYEYEKTRLDALKNGYFWKNQIKELRIKYKVPHEGFIGENFLIDFYNHFRKELKSLNIKTKQDMLVNYESAIDLIVVEELESFAKEYDFQREYIYSLFFFNQDCIRASGIQDIAYFDGIQFVPKERLKKGAYIRYHPLMSKKDILRLVNIVSGMTDNFNKIHKLKTQKRVYDKESYDLYIKIEKEIISQIGNGTPLKHVLKKACICVEEEVDDYRDFKIYQDFYKDYIKVLRIPRFSTKITGI